MTGFRLSPLRNKGWLRFTLVGAALTIPAAAIEHSLGYFSDGAQGLTQAAEFVAAGIAMVLMVGFSANWVLHGFAVKQKDEDEGEEARPSRPSGPAAAHPPQHRGTPPQHH